MKKEFKMKNKWLVIKDNGAVKSVVSSHLNEEKARYALRKQPTSNSVFLLTYQLMTEEEWTYLNSPPYIPSEG